MTANIRPPAKHPPPAPPRGGRYVRGALGYLIRLTVLGGLLVGVFYALYLNQVVRERFEGQRWALPARVYAQPLELYPGRALTPEELAQELERLGYVKGRQPERPGAYAQERERFLVRTRPFRFWDGQEPSHHLEIRLSGDQVQQVRKVDEGEEVPLVRLDPVLIASIYPTHNEDRVLLPRADLPELLVKSLLAVEDRNYHEHFGVYPPAIMRAMVQNFRAGRVVEGGSTLTQQLVKNFYLSNERSLWRKLNEAAMAVLLELHYSKDEILEAYANEIYLGQDGRRAIHGFGLASHFFFNRPLADLELPQIALLVGIIKGPSFYDPRHHPERARARRDLILDVLAAQGLITDTQAASAKQAGLGVTQKGGRPAGRYPAFLDLVRRQLQRDYREEDLRSAGLSIFTTLDLLVQTQAEQAIAGRLPGLERGKRRTRALEAAAVVAGAENGEVQAVVGGRQAGFAGFNRALDAARPIGSLIKPVIYLDALTNTSLYTLVSPLEDYPLEIRDGNRKPWQPKNFDGRNHGRVPLYLALARSYNLATVRLGLDLGVDQVVARLRDLGVERERLPAVPALLLGAVSLSPLEVTQIYQTIAAGGFRVPLRAVREVLDMEGRLLNRYPLEVKQIADPEPVYLLTWAMRKVVEMGTGRELRKWLPAGLAVAGKTGTTNDFRDSWFAGFSGDKVAVVWVGRDDNESMGLTGATGAMRLWSDIIAGSHSQPLEATAPEGLDTVWVEPASGLRADGRCQGTLQLPFVRGTAPRDWAPCTRREAPSPDPSEPSEPSDPPDELDLLGRQWE